MKTVINYIKDFWKEDFHLAKYLYAFIFIATCISLNYVFDFNNKFVRSPHGGFLGFLFFFLFYAFAYFSVAIPCLLFSKAKYVFRNPLFWIKSLAFVFVIAISVGFNYQKEWLKMMEVIPERQYLSVITTQLRWVVIFLPALFILKMIFDKGMRGLYGLKKSKMNWGIYFMLLLIVSPLIIGASFTPDFLNAYPRFRPWQMDAVFGLPKAVMTVFFELSYGANFMMIELMFRGALVIGMSAIMGKNSILPMVSIYAFIHFGKPIGETISSVFGGYILGIIAWRTRSIWGGVIIHLGVAWLMELMGFMQFYIIGMKR
jgi:hypothetical protein